MDPTSMQAILIETLQQALNQNVAILKQAEAKLTEWETQPGFYTMLYNIGANHSIDLSVRFLAITCIKNGVDRYWRTNAPNAISEEEKSALRGAFLTNFHEPVLQISSQLAHVISRVARMDAPSVWPELFPTLLQAVESNDVLIQHRALLTLHNVVKVLATKRLAGYRRIFQDFTSNIYPYILNLWNKFADALINNLMQNCRNSMAIKENIEKSLLSLKILKKLTLHGFYKPHLNEHYMNFMKTIFERTRAFMDYQKQFHDLNFQMEFEKLIINLTKTLVGVLDMHPLSFVEFIQPTLELTVYYTFTSAGEGLLFERFILQCFELIKRILMCPEFKPPKIKEVTKEQATLQAHQIKTDFFQPNVLVEICKKLVYYYFILTQEDLEKWDLDPELYAIDEAGGESWKYNLKPSMECLFIALFRAHRETLRPVLLEMVSETSNLVSPDDIEGILRKDAVYNAAGLVAFDMFDEINFDQWFTTTLLEEIKVKHNNYRVIRRRVSLLISNWTAVQLSGSLRPALYMAINDLLCDDEDMAVKLSAAIALKHAVDDNLFNPEQFRDYIDTTFHLLFNLLKQAKECDTKMQVLTILTIMIERAGETLLLHFEVLIGFLPLLWAESEDHNMLRCAIVCSLVEIIKIYGSIKPEMYQFLLPIIHYGTNTQQSAILYLLEDSLELWQVVLEHSTDITNEMLQLFNNIPPLFEYSTEHWRIILLIIDAYLLLAPEIVIKTQIYQIIKVYDSIIGDLKFEATIAFLQLVLNIVTISPQLGTEAIKLILPRVLTNIISPNDFSMIIMSLNLCIMGRVLTSSFPIFEETVREVSHRNNKTEEEILTEFLDVWLKKMENVSKVEYRKLLAMALTNLLTSQIPVVMQKLPDVILNIVQVLTDILEDDNSDGLIITNDRTADDLDVNRDSSNHCERRKQLMMVDPVYYVVLKDYFQSQIRTLQAQLGSGNFQVLKEKLGNGMISVLEEYKITL